MRDRVRRGWLRAGLGALALACPIATAATASADELPVTVPELAVTAPEAPDAGASPVSVPEATVPEVPEVPPVTGLAPGVTVPETPAVTGPPEAPVEAPVPAPAPGADEVLPAAPAPTPSPTNRSVPPPASDATTAVTSLAPSLAAATRQAAAPFAVPLGAMVLIAAYVVGRGTLDRRDARLRTADADDRWIGFE